MMPAKAGNQPRNRLPPPARRPPSPTGDEEYEENHQQGPKHNDLFSIETLNVSWHGHLFGT